jgi:hypothetical protein
MEIKYRYESEGFDLDGKAYLPDFWLPDLNFRIEIKPSPPNHKEIEKVVMLEERTGDCVMFFLGIVGRPNATESIIQERTGFSKNSSMTIGMTRIRF